MLGIQKENMCTDKFPGKLVWLTEQYQGAVSRAISVNCFLTVSLLNESSQSYCFKMFYVTSPNKGVVLTVTQIHRGSVTNTQVFLNR